MICRTTLSCCRTPPSPRISANGSPSIADLAAMAQQLLDGSLRGIEERLRRAICPLPPHPPQATAAGADNTSLPSQTPAPQRPSAREPTANQQLHEPVEPDETDAPPPTNPQTVQQPPVQGRMRQHIVGGEFVFDNLLHDSLFPARYGASASPSLALRIVHDRSTSGEVLIAQQRSPNRRVVRDLASWLEACNTYISVLVAHYPARALKLFAYQRNICDASSRFPADCWISCMRCDGPISALGQQAPRSMAGVLHSPCFLPVTRTCPPNRRKASMLALHVLGDLYDFHHSCPHNPFQAPKRPTTPPGHAAGRLGRVGQAMPLALLQHRHSDQDGQHTGSECPHGEVRPQKCVLTDTC